MPDLNTYNNICALFDQLGLASDEASITDFFTQHAPLQSDIHIWEAPFWNPSQAAFLHEALKQDANWQMAVDELNMRLRAEPS